MSRLADTPVCHNPLRGRRRVHRHDANAFRQRNPSACPKLRLAPLLPAFAGPGLLSPPRVVCQSRPPGLLALLQLPALPSPSRPVHRRLRGPVAGFQRSSNALPHLFPPRCGVCHHLAVHRHVIRHRASCVARPLDAACRFLTMSRPATKWLPVAPLAVSALPLAEGALLSSRW